MSNNSDESDSMTVLRDPADSPSVDEGSCGGSLSGGGAGLKKGPWTAAEDAMLMDYVKKHGEGNWNQVQKHSGLSRCGKSCRLRWANHLRPNLKKGSFTPEEEQKIIELHSRMGNKWARMASHLPGRTDNEIKNYWNTRIKRRQRAGLPLYPPELRQPGSSEGQLNCDTSDLGITSDKWQNELLQPNNCAVPDITFEGYKLDQAVIAFPPNLFEKSVGNLLSQGIGSRNYSSPFPGNLSKRLRVSDTILPSYTTPACVVPSFLQYPSGDSSFSQYPSGDSGGAPLIDFNIPYDPDPGSKDLSTLIDEFTGSHALPNGNFSASTSLVGNAKLELPSLQYSPVHDPCSWLVSPSASFAETDIMSPLGTDSIQSECMSPRNSGLLDAVLYESQTMVTERIRPTVKTSSSSVAANGGVAESVSLNPCDADWEAYDPISPLGCSATSIFSECTPPNSGCLLEETHNMSGMHVKFETDDLFLEFAKEKELPPLDLTQPDVLLALGWCKNGTLGQSFTEQSTNLIGEYLSDYRPLQSAASPSCSEGQALGSSCPWNNMPPVCQFPELP